MTNRITKRDAQVVKKALTEIWLTEKKIWYQELDPSPSSLMRSVQVLTVKDGQIQDISGLVGKAMQLPVKAFGVRTDMGGGELVHYLGVALFGESNDLITYRI